MKKILSLLLMIMPAASISLCSTLTATAGESTMPAQYQDIVKPEVASKYSYTEDGAYTKSLDIPTYEWMPVGQPPKIMILGVHGLTLHGRRFRVLARTLAVNGVGFVSLDMRGFGQCRFDDKKQFSTPDDDKSKVDYEKSYEDIVKLAQLIKQNYPDTRLVALGESLGCTFCVRLAAEHPDLISGIILSAPAVHLNNEMFVGHGQVRQGVKAVVKPHHEIDMSSFFADICSQRESVKNEMLDDPFILKKMPMKALIATDKFVEKTAKWGKDTDPHLAVLVIQGSVDGCVSPKHVVDLLNNMPSNDQTLDWRGKFGHLQFETAFMRAPIIDAVSNWLINHGRDHQGKLKGIQQNIADLGGTITE